MSRFTANNLAFFFTHRLGAQGMQEGKAPLWSEGKGSGEPGRGKDREPDLVSEALKMWNKRKRASIGSNANGHLACLWL